MLKFLVMFLCVLCHTRQVWNAPIIKGSGVQWSEPKGNGKGNLTLIMIPQNNSCNNDTDMLIAVKSDYQVVSQDTQLLNLVINEYQNDTLKESKCNAKENEINGIKSSNLDENQNKVNQGNDYNTNSNKIGIVNQATHTDDDIQYNQGNSPKLTGKIDLNSNDLNEPNKMVDDITPNTIGKQNSELNVPKLDSNENQEPQGADDFNTNRGNDAVISDQSSRASDSITHADFLKFLNSVGEVEQSGTSELESGKGSNSVNFYEAEKKTPVQGHEQNSAGNNSQSVGKEYPTNENAENIFRFLSAAQTSGTTGSVTKNPLDVFKFLKGAESSHISPSSTQAVSLVDYNNLNTTDRNSITSSSTISSQSSQNNSQLFSDSEINIFKQLNISEPNIGNKRKKITAGNVITKNSPQNEDSDENLLNEAINIFGKSKQEPVPGECNLRSDSLTGNQAEELAALVEGDVDTKGKLSKGDYSASGSKEEILEKQSDLVDTNYIGAVKAEVNGNSGCNEGEVTTCYVVKVSKKDCTVDSHHKTNPQTTPVISVGDRENSATEVNSEAVVSTVSLSTIASPTDSNVKVNAGDHSKTTQEAKVATVLSSKTNASPTGDNEKGNADEGLVTTVSPPATSISFASSASPTCRTSIVYICNNQKPVTGAYEQISEKVEEKIVEMSEELKSKSQAAIKESPKKITLEPNKDCASVLKTKQLTDSITDDQIVEPNLNAQLKEKELFPLLESAVFLANRKEMSKGNNLPVVLNTSSSDYNIGVSSSSDNKKLANVNPSETTLVTNEEHTNEDVPQQLGGVINNKNAKITIKNSNSMNEQVIHPGQVLRMRLAGKKLIMDELPSYRSESFDKNCDSTPTTEPPVNEMECDDEENVDEKRTKKNEVTQRAKTLKSTNEQTESNKRTYSHTTVQAESQEEKTPETEEEMPVFVTECKTVQVLGKVHNSKSISEAPIMNKEDKPLTESCLMTDSDEKETTSICNAATKTCEVKDTWLNTFLSQVMNQEEKKSTKPCFDYDVSATKKPHVSISLQKPSENSKQCKQNITVPEDSVKEIIIQIIRNTKKPGKCDIKPTNHIAKDNSMPDDISFQNNKILEPGGYEKIKHGGYEMEMSSVDNDQNLKYLYSEPEENKIELGSVDKHGIYPYFDKKNSLLDNFYVGKENNDEIPAFPDSDKLNKAIYKDIDTNEKAISYSDLKLLIDSNNVINGA